MCRAWKFGSKQRAGPKTERDRLAGNVERFSNLHLFFYGFGQTEIHTGQAQGASKRAGPNPGE
jgi:hypothetical protein